ncbi:MAG: hypothetical protein ACI9OU_001287 [Candidatus Promineifilaceae bacterium]|jgi:hypothetical protein
MLNIEKTEFNGLDAISLETEAARIVAVSSFGPRIAFAAPSGCDNLLLWEPEKYTRGAWDLRGGHRVWATRPLADESEDTYATDNDPCEVTMRDDGVRMMGAENAMNRTRRGIDISVIDDTHFRIDNILVNAGEMLYSGAVWALTCTIPLDSAEYAIPVGDGSEWDTFTMVNFRRWGGHGMGGYNDPQIIQQEDLVRIVPAGVENKRMLYSQHGIIAMSDPVRDITFAKRIDGKPTGPLGTNMAFYIGPDNFMVEMETMGSEVTLRPGETINHTEEWVIKKGATPLSAAPLLVDLFN